MKEEILKLRSYEKLDGRKDILKGFKHYSKLVDSVEIDISEFNTQVRDEKLGFNIDYLKLKQLPFKTMFFTETNELSTFMCLFVQTSRPAPLYELFMFDRRKPDRHLDYLGCIRIDLKEGDQDISYPEYVEMYTDHDESQYKVKTEEQKTLLEEVHEIDAKLLKVRHSIFDLNSELMEDFLYMTFCAITCINDNRLLHTETENLEEVDNQVLHIVGDETRIIKLTPGLNQSRYKLLNKRESPRFHNVRGHFRHYKNGKIVFVDSFPRGDKDKGIITSIYIPQTKEKDQMLYFSPLL